MCKLIAFKPIFKPITLIILVCLLLYLIKKIIFTSKNIYIDYDDDDEVFTCYDKLGINPPIFPHPTKCDVFYICFFTTAVKKHCNFDGWEFDNDLKKCVPISDNGCTANQNLLV
ncbi:Mv-ORF118 peptide [Maruca vitrata nucleopolyhedrovirus]|uniref:Mv-ORF118 peptide n=1 Tax=Maruca vitrata nucleopolyhedrovirus TaxID=1307954 RepID=A1YRI0_9ABAC|nr:Mv-ORF118 peptide [Maruca vitrata nucleopolyhedrovirus]ABM05434.1 Mv-ORF118 peptide [Maruca vitrata nucleopolyhedrovirus]